MSQQQQRILVIKLSALGDFIQAMGPCAAIRAHHPDARITLLTTKPYAAMAEQSPYFDDIWIDTRPKAWEVAAILKLRRQLRSVNFDMVYDLQTSDRSSSYYHMMGDPPWSGIAHGCSHPHDNPDRDFMHTIDRQSEQLAMAGIERTPQPDLRWLESDITRFKLPARYLLMVPGGAAHRPGKRWSAENFAEIANRLGQKGVSTVILGTHHDAEPIKAILERCPTALSLADKTNFADIATLARNALAAVGNDTGPMHIVAAAGCASVVLFSADSNPDLCAPRGRVTILRKAAMAEITPDEVGNALQSWLPALT